MRRRSSAWVIILSCLAAYVVLAMGFRSFVQPVANSYAAAKVGPPVEQAPPAPAAAPVRAYGDPVRQARVDVAPAAASDNSPPAAAPKKTPRKQLARNSERRDQFGFRSPFDFASRSSNGGRPWF